MPTDASARTLSGLFDDATFTSKSDVKLMRIHGIVPNYMANMASSRGGGVVHIGAVAECAAPRQRLTSTSSETVLVAAASQSTLCCERVMNRDGDSTHMVAQYTAMHARCALPPAPCAQKMKKGKRVKGKETEGGF